MQTAADFETHIQIKAPYLAHLCHAVFAAATKVALDPFILLAIADRESRGGLALRPDGKGTDGHGCGIFQIDDRYHRDFCASGAASDPLKSANYAAELLKSDYRALGVVKNAVAAYNCGRGAVKRALAEGRDPDECTTGSDYSKWVMRRAAQLRGA